MFHWKLQGQIINFFFLNLHLPIISNPQLIMLRLLPHSLPAGQQAENNCFLEKRLWIVTSWNHHLKIVNLLLWGEKAIQKNVGFHNLQEIFLNLDNLKAVIWLAMRTVGGTYQCVLKQPHNYENFSACWPIGDERRVIGTWSAVGYRQSYLSDQYFFQIIKWLFPYWNFFLHLLSSC